MSIGQAPPMPVPAWGRPPWTIEVEIPREPPPGRVDVAVVGAGFAGLATAVELARAGARVAVLEAGRIGGGASGHTGGIALEGTAIGELEEADDCLASLRRVTERAGIECGLRLEGCLEVAHRAAPDPRRAPWRDGDAFLCPTDRVPGGTVDAGALVSGLARAVVAAGGTIHEHHRVEGLAFDGGVDLRMSAGTVRAGRAVVAVNGYFPTLFRFAPDLRVALTLAIATGPLDEPTLAAIGLADRLPFYTVDLPYLWGRVLADGRAVFGSGLLFPHDDDVRSVDVGSLEARDAFARLEARSLGLHPALATRTIAFRWGGPIAFLPGRAPILDHHPESRRVVVTGGCSGHGVALSFRIAEIVAAHLMRDHPLPSWGALER